MSDSDLIALYSSRILQLTTQIAHLGRLDAPTGTGFARSPHCGSTVTTDVVLTGGRITAFAQDVKACALGQASAALFAAHVIGMAPADVAALRAQVAAMLLGADAPPAPFDGYQVLTAARAYKNRHASILLCLDATLLACT